MLVNLPNKTNGKIIDIQKNIQEEGHVKEYMLLCRFDGIRRSNNF